MKKGCSRHRLHRRNPERNGKLVNLKFAFLKFGQFGWRANAPFFHLVALFSPEEHVLLLHACLWKKIRILLIGFFQRVGGLECISCEGGK